MATVSYKDAGVDIDAGNQFVENIKPYVKSTMIPGVLGGIGSLLVLLNFQVVTKTCYFSWNRWCWNKIKISN